MTKEQKEAIEMKENSEEIEKLKKVLEERYLYVPGMRTVYARLMCLEKEDIVRDDLSLRNEIHQHIKENEEKDKEIETLKRDFKIVNQECSRLERKEAKKEKQTDLMAEYISKIDIEEDICIKNKTNPDWCNEDYTNCKDCIKQYFERQVEECLK